MKGLDDMLRRAQEMQSKMLRIQEELGGLTVTGSAGGGMIRVTATGRQEITDVLIDKACVDPEDVELLQDLVRAAANDAIELKVARADLNLAGTKTARFRSGVIRN